VNSEIEPLPPGAILLHVGPYKTGSTAIQQSLFDQRAALAEHGVHYPDKWRRLFREGHSLMQHAPRGLTVPPPSVWDDFAAGLRARPEMRVCLSTEDFGRIRNPERSRKIVHDLGADRLHVLAVARAYHRLLPSHWQERVKSTEKLTYDEWLHQLFEGDDTQAAHRSFWTSHDIERMAALWLEVLPPAHFTVVVTDDSDRLLLSHVFEQLLDLPPGLLAPGGSANASLSANAAEVLRRVNVAFAEHGWSDRDYRALVRQGVARALQAAGRPPYDEPMPPLPEWVRPLVRVRSQARVDALGELGVRVVGDPTRLLPPEQDRTGDSTGDRAGDGTPAAISVEAAVAAVVGALEAGLRQRPRDERADGEDPPPPAPGAAPAPAVEDAGGRDLVRELGKRARRRLPGGR
jgi:hypothetical protein